MTVISAIVSLDFCRFEGAFVCAFAAVQRGRGKLAFRFVSWTFKV